MPYLAMTAAEFRACADLPEKTAWLACHFSPGGSGLTNLPRELPPKSLLILDDSTPIRGHDARRVQEALWEAVACLECCGVLLDFERAPDDEGMAMTKVLLGLPCPVCVAAEYGKDLDCPVFLPPLWPTQRPEDVLKAWTDREIWLDCGPAAATVTVTEQGSRMAPGQEADRPHFDGELYCHYGVEVKKDRALFHLKRTREDLRLLLEDARKWGVTRGVGLWQELHP